MYCLFSFLFYVCAMVRIFKGCDLKFTVSERVLNIQTDLYEYKFSNVLKEQVYVRTNSKNKTIQYFDFSDGVTARWVRKLKTKIEGGEEIDEVSFLADWEQYKTENNLIIN